MKEFLVKIDQFKNVCENKFSCDIHCQVGCFDCCQADLSITRLEAKMILEYLQENHIKLSNKRNHPKHCLNLDPTGKCHIYPVRPVVCRTHGLPVDYKNDEGKKLRSTCFKNFTHSDISQLASTDVLNGDTINLMLGALNLKYFQNIDRFPLEEIGRTIMDVSS